jgi:hypothetical protein
MPVTSTPINSTAHPSATRPSAYANGGCALLIGKIGMWMAVLSFGGIFWAVNGGFSVIGLGVLASSFNDAGRLFWAAVSQLTFAVPVSVPGLPTTQPLIPWIGVVAASLLQISVAWLKLSKWAIPKPLLITAVLLSIYDYVTTVAGLGTIPWMAKGGIIPALVIALPLTFAIEAAIGFALKRR